MLRKWSNFFFCYNRPSSCIEDEPTNLMTTCPDFQNNPFRKYAAWKLEVFVFPAKMDFFHLIGQCLHWPSESSLNRLFSLNKIHEVLVLVHQKIQSIFIRPKIIRTFKEASSNALASIVLVPELPAKELNSLKNIETATDLPRHVLREVAFGEKPNKIYLTFSDLDRMYTLRILERPH